MIVTFCSMKGGVGKSSNAMLTANNLASRGFKVLYLDFDTNNSGTLYYTLGLCDSQTEIEELVETKNVYKMFCDLSVKNFILESKIENVDIIPSSLRLFDIRSIEPHQFKNKIVPTIQGYDYVIIDTAPTYDNIVMSAIIASDIILTPVVLDFFNFTTTRFLKSHLQDEIPEQFKKWYLFYTRWQEKLVPYANSAQSQEATIFEQEYSNILQVQIPETPAVGKYTLFDEKVSVNSGMLGSQRLAKAINKLVNMLTGEDKIVEAF